MLLEDIYENEHSKECYARFGLAVYYSQVLELQLVNMIVLLKFTQNVIPSERDFDALYERKMSNTMGQLINEIKQLFLLEDEESNELTEVLRLRNFIVHDYYKEKISLTFTRDGRDEMIKEFTEFVERVRNLDSKLVSYTNALHKKLGITQQMLEEGNIKRYLLGLL